ncbi:hypothetical protein F443_22378 [Phytophthora nicotianae P1569]|uniref:Uncharacterized protein n=1 Tax=Phytophthora nicotianae P1569 TaxID=1317065 RepID=V9DV41_PHYNI|nr:hypothetical protein F443_22378 [Phytophthora nicotianae P1569]
MLEDNLGIVDGEEEKNESKIPPTLLLEHMLRERRPTIRRNKQKCPSQADASIDEYDEDSKGASEDNMEMKRNENELSGLSSCAE